MNGKEISQAWSYFTVHSLHSVQDDARKASEESVVDKDTSFYEDLINPIASQMMRSIWRIVRNREVAEDTLQEALTVIWKKKSRIYKHPNPRALILKICVNTAYDSLRKQKRYREHGMTGLTDNAPHPGNSVHEDLEKKSALSEILYAIQRLPRKQALAVLMRIVEGMSYDEIAQAMGCDEVTVRVHVSRGRERLSQWLSHLNPASGKEVSK